MTVKDPKSFIKQKSKYDDIDMTYDDASLNIENVVVAGSFLPLPGAAWDTACQPNTTQLTTEAFWTGRRGVSEVRYILFNSEFGFCDILSSVKNVCSRIQ